MTTETTPRSRKPLYASLAAAIGVLALLLVLGLARPGETPPARSQDTPVAQVPRLEATPAPGATIDPSELTPAERVYISHARAWGTIRLDTAYWTDQHLLEYGYAVCASLDASLTRDEHRDNLAAAQARGGGLMGAEDAAMMESAAVNAWCPEHMGAAAELP